MTNFDDKNDMDEDSPSESEKPSLVPFLDTVSGRVVQIPASELRPGAIEVQVQGMEGLVWVLAEDLHQGELRHPPFDDEVRERIRRIQSAFAEHHPLSFAEWEDGFRRDAHPEREIALWLRAADVFEEFAAGETSSERRADVFRCVLACLSCAPDDIWQVLRLESLDRRVAERVIERFDQR